MSQISAWERVTIARNPNRPKSLDIIPLLFDHFFECAGDRHFDDDKAYIWISFGGDDSYSQSKNKLYTYFNEGTDIALKDISNLTKGLIIPHKGSVAAGIIETAFE